MESFDPPRTASTGSHSFESITITTMASVCMEDTFAVLEKQSPAAPSISVVHRHEEMIQVSEEVEAVRSASFTESFDLHPRWDAEDDDDGLKRKNFSVAAVPELHNLLGSTAKEVDVFPGGSTNTIPASQLKLLEWERKNELELEAKRIDEKNRLAEIVDAAEERKQEFFARRNAAIEAMKKINREKQQESLESREEFHARAPSNYWAAVSELIVTKPVSEKKRSDLAAKQELKPGKPTDLSRMRQIILKLKHRTAQR